MPPPTPSTEIQYIKGVRPGRAAALKAARDRRRSAISFTFFPSATRTAATRPASPTSAAHRRPGAAARPGRLRARQRLAPTQDAAVRGRPRGRHWLGEADLVQPALPGRSDQAGRSARGLRPPRVGTYGSLAIESPDWEKFEGDEAEEGAIVPIYSKVANIPPKALRRIVATALETLPALPDPLAEDLRKRLVVGDLASALREIHQPRELTPQFLSQRSPRPSPGDPAGILHLPARAARAARYRRDEEEDAQGQHRRALRAEVKKILPFKLTGAQKRVLREIAADLRSEQPMYRLLQGDVGSGKTIVALIAAMILHPQRTPGRVARTDRDSGRAALPAYPSTT